MYLVKLIFEIVLNLLISKDSGKLLARLLSSYLLVSMVNLLVIMIIEIIESLNIYRIS